MKLSTQKSIGENLKILRASRNMSQAELAKKTGLTRSLYAQYELGNRTPDGEFLFTVSMFYGINMHLLFEPNTEKFLSEISISKMYSDGIDQLAKNYHELCPFSKGRLLEFSEQLLEWDKFRQAKQKEIEKVRNI